MPIPDRLLFDTAMILAGARAVHADAVGLPGTQGPIAVVDFWGLVEQAGPLRWPIFAVLAIGLVLVFAKLYELTRDRSLSRSLFQLDLPSAGIDALTSSVAAQRESMLASLQSAMLNVFHTRPTEGMLHDEIANFVAFQQDQFAVFRRRMEFLSDTAGALGLMGTVWGMFQVFFQGTSDKEVILRGMGIALITTLLGLVVSIILNLFATELSSFFDKTLERVSAKSNQLRFRLLELAPPNDRAVAAVRHPVSGVTWDVSPPPVVAAATVQQSAKPAPLGGQDSWCYLETNGTKLVNRAGETLKNVNLKLVCNGDTSSAGTAVTITLPPGAGSLNGAGRHVRLDVDSANMIQFDWTAPERAGACYLEAAVLGQAGHGQRIDMWVEPGAAARVEQVGNHQAAVAGMRLPTPLSIRVFDQFDNPVPGVPVTFAVTHGNGRLAGEGRRAALATDASGTAGVPFAVASEAGPNGVVAEVDGGAPSLEFQVFGTEV